MFGLATREDVLGLTAEVRALGKQLKPAIEPTKLYTVEVLQGGKSFRTYRDVVKIEDNRLRANAIMFGGVSSLILKTRNGEVILRGEGYEYIATEQKPEGEKANEPDVYTQAQAKAIRESGLYSIGAFNELRKYADELNHRIEMLELRMNKQKPQPKGAKR